MSKPKFKVGDKLMVKGNADFFPRYIGFVSYVNKPYFTYSDWDYLLDIGDKKYGFNEDELVACVSSKLIQGVTDERT